MAQAYDLVTLSTERLRLTLSPSIGGAISAFDCIDGAVTRPLLRKCNNRLENVLDAASFPLVPFVNRIRGGRFSFRGREITLKPNMAGDPSPLHGQGWLAPWTVEQADERWAVLSFRHAAGEWPWDYEARQHFALEEQALSLTLTCRNSSSEPMPCGLGQHPYFPCGPETRLDTKVTDVWTVDADVLPVEKVPATGRYDLCDRPICGQDLDNGFAGWSGEARISDPQWPYELRLTSPDARFFQVYSPARGGLFVAEPVSHANAALNTPEADWAELGLRVLEPGEEMRLDMRLEVRPR
ncbi:MAG TPA: aldose 1-epimerase [Sphingomicrobium sp.]|nr:aldose 1-epimerase [Sphingomicrobium sp.]